MVLRACLAVCVAAVLLPAEDKKLGPVSGQASDKSVKLEVTAYLDKASITQAVGAPLDEGIVVLAVKLTPAEGQKIPVNRDDFLLRSDRDGQRSTPYAPSQVAGSTVLRVNSRVGGGAVMSENRGPTWGGIGGGMPRQLPGNNPGIGNSAGVEEAVASVDENSGKQKENPVLAVLKEKVLAEKETDQPIAGQLYFLMEGKQKVKDIELIYKTPAGSKISVRFK